MMTPGQKRKYERSGDPYSLRRAKLPQSNTLKETDDRPKIVPYHRQDNSKTFLTNLLYLIPLKDTMKMLVPFYWDPGKKIIDVTAGQRIIWGNFLYNCISPCGFEHWHIDFNDIAPECQADYHVPAQEIHTLGKHWDILVCDFPFTELKNGVESFGVKTKREYSSTVTYTKPQKFRRDFYFRNFVPLDQLFPQCVEPFNKVADNLIVKIGDSHKNKRLLTNHVYAILAFDKAHNPASEFNLIDCVHYRGNYARRGGRFPFAQSVVSYYLIFKKRPSER